VLVGNARISYILARIAREKGRTCGRTVVIDVRTRYLRGCLQSESQAIEPHGSSKGLRPTLECKENEK